jgi:hypothetical protein
LDMDESSKLSEKNINLNKDEMNNNKTDQSPEENLVKDLEESLTNTIEETLVTLHSLIDIVKTNIDDPSVIDETEKIVELINKNISSAYIKNINQLSSLTKQTKDSKSSEEE